MLVLNKKLTSVLAAVAGLALVASVSLAQPEAPKAPPAPREGQPDGDAPRREAPDRRQEGRGQGQGELGNLEAAMKLINRSARKLKSQIADPEKKEENLKLLNDIERGAIAAKGMPVPQPRGPRGPRGGEGPGGRAPEAPAPKDADAKPEGKDQPKPAAAPSSADKAKRTAEYRGDLMKLARQALDIEQDLIDGKFDQAKTDLDKIATLKDESHKALGVRKERDDD